MSPRLIRRVLSLFVFYHLIVVGILPNRTSLLSQGIKGAFLPYMNLFSFSGVWQLFAPDPANAFVLKYKVSRHSYGEASTAEDVITEGRFPRPREEYPHRLSYFRDVLSARFLMGDVERINQIFVPWLCRIYPGPNDVDVYLETETLPAPSDVRSGLADERSRFVSTVALSSQLCASGELEE